MKLLAENTMEHCWINQIRLLRKQTYLGKEKVLFHYDNAPAHTFNCMQKASELHYELLPHAPYLPDLVPSEFFPVSKSEEMDC